MIIWVAGVIQTFAGASGLCPEKRDDHLGLWYSENLQKDGGQKDNSGGTRKFGRDQQDGQDEWGQKRDDHLGLWDCGTVGLLRAFE